MLEEQGSQLLPAGTVDPPADPSGCDISDDTIVLIWRSLGRLKPEYRDNLREWIEDEAARCSCVSWLCGYLPPATILQLPDLLEKLWGFERLLAYDVYRDLSESDLPLYESYLEKFYSCHDHCSVEVDDVIREYLEKEKTLASELEAAENKFSIPYDESSSTTLQEYFSGLLNDAEKERRPFLTYAVAYLTKEIELMTEWLRKGYEPGYVHYDLMFYIRDVALKLAMLKGKFMYVHTAATLLGMTVEVEFLLKRASNGNLEPIRTSTSILGDACDYLELELCGFKSDAMLVTSTVEVNQLTGGNTESMSLGKSNLEQCVPPEVSGNILLRPQEEKGI